MVHANEGKRKFFHSTIAHLLTAFTIVLFITPLSFGFDILYVAGDKNPKAADKAIIEHLKNRGFTVHVKEDETAQPSDADNKDLIFISESVLAMKVNTKFRDVAIPIICSEPWLYDDFGMTGGIKFKDFGRKAKQKTICITDTSHPMSGALSGVIKVSSKTNYFGWGIPGRNAIRVACLNKNDHKYVIFGYPAGVVMPGLVAPGKRVGVFMFRNSGSCLTADGWCLFDAVVDWTMEEKKLFSQASQ